MTTRGWELQEATQCPPGNLGRTHRKGAAREVNLRRVRRYLYFCQGTLASADDRLTRFLEHCIADAKSACWADGHSPLIFRELEAWLRHTGESYNFAVGSSSNWVSHALCTLSGTERKALLLVTLEEFSEVQIAFVLNLSVAEAAETMAAAEGKVAAYGRWLGLEGRNERLPIDAIA